ncbi:AraC family transcriptional regulator [Cricetibacter osteomyelitidis]|uniref:AraC family transcriptional regulator n=1 Tax=Cricetibacter osteomyelitidis TaxID=1521931 RepID=A0A4R2SUH0_9PAST|nr:XylR family transcriptional regulator [Cricetibacter osteomyelitidis]TCP92136.1 AraC family transcriptional regulator [Cricetibacter osteomyelitidis]
MAEQKNYCVALLFNANKVYDRGVVEGIGQYIQASQCAWNIFMEDDFVYHQDTIESLFIDGIIADFDDLKTVKLLQNVNIPIVGVGGSYQNPDFYPNLPYVATDNYALVEAAFLHLKNKGISNFAFYGIATEQEKHWSNERQAAFGDLMQQHEYQGHIYKSGKMTADNWLQSQQQLGEWLKTLPEHTGIIAVTDARARHLLSICEELNIPVPEQLCVIGIDNEELIQYLSRVSLSSVTQSTQEIGYQAAKLLHRVFSNLPINHKPILISPQGVVERSSTDYRSLHDPLVIQAMHFIRHRACHGIKVEQVLDHLRTSRSNLESRFKSEMNKTIHQVIHEEKINRAKNLLLQTDLPIQEIADVCGYPSLQYFYSVFKKELEQTPKEFRDKY